MADKPVTREEKYLAYLTGDYKGELPKPITRKEKYLYELCLKGIGGEISPEEIKNAVNEYLEKNPVLPGATTEQAQQIEQNKTDVASLKEETGSLKEDLDKLNEGGLNLKDEVIEEDIRTWLDEHPEATTTVQDYSLTIDKMVIGTLGYVTPEMFSAIGDGVTDDSDAIITALNSGYEVVFNNKVYAVAKKITITNKKVKFNGCTLKRIGSNMEILDFSNSSDMIIENVNITDIAGTKGTMVVGIDCYNVVIKNLSVVCNSSHETSNASWATTLSGERFLIDGVYINSYNYGIWGDGLHFVYIVDSIIKNFLIYSGDDCIAITQHEKGGTGPSRNITSQNNIFSGGVLYSAKASAIRLGFDNSGLKTTDEINNIYCEDIKFDNILVVSKYFIRDEYYRYDTSAVPNSSKRITFSNITFKLKNYVKDNYLPIHVSNVYAWDDFKFINCNFYTYGTTLFTSEGEGDDRKIYFSDCNFDIKCFNTGIVKTGLNFSKCNIKCNYDNSSVVLSKDLTITDSVIDNHGTGSFAKVVNNDAIIMINNVKTNKRIIAPNSTKLGVATNIHSSNTRYDSVCGLQLYNGVFSDKIVNNYNNLFYIKAESSISFDLKLYNILALTPVYKSNKLYTVYYYSDGRIKHSFDSSGELSTHLNEDGLTITYDTSARKLTISNTLSLSNLVEIRMLAQSN